MKRAVCFLFLLSLVQTGLAIIRFTSPLAGTSLQAGRPFDVTWEREDSRHTTATTNADQQWFDDVERIDLFLCAGGNEENTNEQLTTLIEQGTPGNDNSVSVTIDSNLGAEAPNAYFLRMVLLKTHGASCLVVHSDRFSITGMTGSFSPAVSNGLISVSGTAGPPSYTSLDKREAVAPPAAKGTAIHNMPYPAQSGAIKYAPMPKAPGTKITITSAPPLFPRSPYKVAKSLLPTPTVETTVSLVPEQTVTSMENTAAAAPDPTDDMEKFLNRWKD